MYHHVKDMMIQSLRASYVSFSSNDLYIEDVQVVYHHVLLCHKHKASSGTSVPELYRDFNSRPDESSIHHEIYKEQRRLDFRKYDTSIVYHLTTE